MRVGKDLADAIMMVSVIVLVLVGTSVFDSAAEKYIIMGALALLTLGMGASVFWAPPIMGEREKAA